MNNSLILLFLSITHCHIFSMRSTGFIKERMYEEKLFSTRNLAQGNKNKHTTPIVNAKERDYLDKAKASKEFNNKALKDIEHK